MLTKTELIAAAQQRLIAASSCPARPARYLADNSGKLLPHSCTLFVYRDLPDAMSFVARSLKTGSGVKCVFERDFQLPPPSSGRITMSLSSSHPDYAASREMWQHDQAAECDMLLLVQDSMETERSQPGDVGIIDSWRLAYKAAQSGKHVHVDLTLLRAAGSRKADGYGVTSSGPASFASIYAAIGNYVAEPTMLHLLQLQGVLNGVILKGGFKRGIVTSMMHSRCPLIHEYLAAPTALLEGSHKKGVILDTVTATSSDSVSQQLRQLIVQQVNSESIFLQKAAESLADKNYESSYSNVCVGIFLPDRGTCLLWRVNLGLVQTREQLVRAYVEATECAVSLHHEWHMSMPDHLRGMWRPLSEDCQVAIDPVGLANMLALHGLTYAEFTEQLEQLLADGCTDGTNSMVNWFADAYAASTARAQQLAAEYHLPPFVRLHTVEPAQSHAFELRDTAGYTLARGIWPPFDSVVNRISDTEATVTVDHGDVETVADVGAAGIRKLNCLWQQLMAQYGLPHAISADGYETMTEQLLSEWWQSPLLTQYYNFAGVVDQSYARKVVQPVAITAACSLDPTQRSACSTCGA